MRRALKHTDKVLWSLVGFVMVLCSVGIVLSILGAVFSRFVLGAAWIWPEEVASTLLLWLTFVGAAYLARRNGHLAFDSLLRMLPVNSQRAVECFNYALILIFLGFFTYYGLRLSLQSWNIQLTTIDVPVGLVRLGIPFAGILMILVYCELLLRAIGIIRRDHSGEA